MLPNEDSQMSSGFAATAEQTAGLTVGVIGTDGTGRIGIDNEGAILFQSEIGQARMRRTEVRPMSNRRAISAFATPARYSFRISPA